MRFARAFQRSEVGVWNPDDPAERIPDRGTAICWRFVDYLRLYHPEQYEPDSYQVLAEPDPAIIDQCALDLSRAVKDDADASGRSYREVMAAFEAEATARGLPHTKSGGKGGFAQDGQRGAVAFGRPSLSSRFVAGVGAVPLSKLEAMLLKAYPRAGADLVRDLVTRANRLGMDPIHLAAIIQLESAWNPAAVNPTSGASGLIQFMGFRAEQLGTSLEEIRGMTALEQMPLVERYLSWFKPLDTEQRAYLAVFYPAAQNWPPDRLFPASVQQGNIGLRTPADYIALVRRHAKLRTASTVEEGMTVGLVFGIVLLFGGFLAFATR